VSEFPTNDEFARLLIGAAWGEVPPSNQIQLSVRSHSRATTSTRVIQLVARITEHYRQWRGKSVRVEGRTVYAEIFVDETSLYMQRFEDVVQEALRGMMADLPKTLAPDLYEVDPRIGLVQEARFVRKEVYTPPSDPFAENVQPPSPLRLPPCPLLDTPGGVYLPLQRPIDFALRERHYRRWSGCALCGSWFEHGEPVVWAGGNLLWVCRDCASPESSLNRL
jgi:hypothetical protein